MKVLPMLRRLGEILLVQWAWMKTWLNLQNNARKAFATGVPDINFWAPTVVIIIGIVMTNLLGVINFVRQGLHADACMAALDMDTPYLAVKHGSVVVSGERCPEWEKLRLRNSVWRSLPLALMTLALALRTVIEIPSCQLAATFGAGFAAAFPHRANESSFVMDLYRDGINISTISREAKFMKFIETIPKPELAALELANEALQLEHDIWNAGHCHESRLEPATLILDKDVSETWSLFLPDDRDSDLGGVASGNLAALNAVMSEQWVALLEKEEAVLKPILLKILNRKGATWREWAASVQVQVVAWETVVGETRALLISESQSQLPQQTFLQSRPWTLAIGNLELIALKSGWKMQIFVSCSLLFVAVLPILKKILATGQVTHSVFMIVVGLYAVVDMLFLVTAWLLCAAAPLACHFGAAFKIVARGWAEAILYVAPEVEAVSVQELATYGPKAFVNVLSKHGFSEEVTKAHDALLPALRWSPLFFLRLVLGSFVFLAASLILSYACRRAAFTTGLSAGVCGPLWLLTEDAGISGSSEGDASCTKGLYFAVVSRSFLLAGVVVLAWWPVDALSVKLFNALIFNRIVDVAVEAYWMALCSLHCVSGLAAAFAIQLSLSAEREKHWRNKLSLPEVSPKRAYGTFEPGQQGP